MTSDNSPSLVALATNTAFQQKPEPVRQEAPSVKPAAIPADTKVDMVQALENLSAVEKWLLTFAGKVGYNPHFTLIGEVRPLQDKIKRGDKTPETYVRAMALKVGDEKLAKPPELPAPSGFIDLTRRGW